MGSWKVRIPLYAAGLATGGAFSTFFTGGALPVFMGAALLALIVGSAGRYRFLLLFPAIGFYTLFAVYHRFPLSGKGWRDLALEVGQDVYMATGTIYSQMLPYDPAPGFFVALIPLAMVVVAFAASATLYEESSIIAVTALGITIGILSTLNFEAGIGPYFAVFLISALILLLFTSEKILERRGLAAAGLIAGVVLILPGAGQAAIKPPLVNWMEWGTAATGGTPRLNADVDVGNYLTMGRDTPLFRVRSTEPLLWRGGTLDHFDGIRWTSTASAGQHDGQEIAPGVPTRRVEQQVEVLGSETNFIFGGYEITDVSLPGAERRSDGSWVYDRPLSAGSKYRVISEVPQPTAEQLQQSGSNYPAGVRERFLQLPSNSPTVLKDTSQRIQKTYEPRTPYEAARAVERYLLYDGGFTYNLSVDYGRGDKALTEFLGSKREGFCTQFATSMALLVREMGVPSRVVYGAAAGQKTGDHEYVVYGRNMHTWVEVYFPGVGWYPFDPTPGFSVTPAMEANAPRANAVDPAPGNDALAAERPAMSSEATAPSTPPQPAGVKTPAENTPVREAFKLPAGVSYSLAFALLLGSIPFTKRALVRRGAPEDLYHGLIGRVRDASWPGRRVAGLSSPALTPAERLLLAAKAVGLNNEPFEAFARSYSEYVYSANPQSDVKKSYRRAIREFHRLPWWQRLIAAFNPASLLVELRRGVIKLSEHTWNNVRRVASRWRAERNRLWRRF